MTLQNEDEELLDYFTTLPKRNLDSHAKHRILQELQHAEQSIKRRRRRKLWTSGMASVSIVAVSFFLFVSGFFHDLGLRGLLSLPPFSVNQPNKLSSTHDANDSSIQTNNPISQQLNTQIKDQIIKIFDSAKEGKVPNIEYAADTSLIDQVEQQWGKADTTEKAGEGHYATFAKNNIVFGFNVNKGNLIFDVRSYDSGLMRINNAEIVSILGAPNDIRYAYGQEIVVYKVSPIFELEWVFTAFSKQDPNPDLDHISVFCQKDAETVQNTH